MTYRTGNTIPNTLYEDDVFIGSTVTGHKAKCLVEAANGNQAKLELLQAVADVAVGVLSTVHEGFREDIDFNVLWDALVAAGLYPPDDDPAAAIPDGGE